MGFNAPDFSRFQVGHDHDRFADQLFRPVMQCYSCNDLALLRSKINLQTEQFVGSFNFFRP